MNVLSKQYSVEYMVNVFDILIKKLNKYDNIVKQFVDQYNSHLQYIPNTPNERQLFIKIYAGDKIEQLINTFIRKAFKNMYKKNDENKLFNENEVKKYEIIDTI